MGGLDADLVAVVIADAGKLILRTDFQCVDDTAHGELDKFSAARRRARQGVELVDMAAEDEDVLFAQK